MLVACIEFYEFHSDREYLRSTYERIWAFRQVPHTASVSRGEQAISNFFFSAGCANAEPSQAITTKN